MSAFNSIAENLWEISRPLKLPGLAMDHRMTVARLKTGELWIHSPVQYDAALALELEGLGVPAHFIAPSRYHDLHWPGWFDRFPKAEFYCPPGMSQDHPELRFHHQLDENQPERWEDELPKRLLRGVPRLNEFVFLHRANRTLIVTDLVLDLDVQKQNLIGRLFLKWNRIYGRVGCSRLFQSLIKDRQAFESSVESIFEWDFDRLVLGHGAVVPRDAKRVLRAGLGPPGPVSTPFAAR